MPDPQSGQDAGALIESLPALKASDKMKAFTTYNSITDPADAAAKFEALPAPFTAAHKTALYNHWVANQQGATGAAGPVARPSFKQTIAEQTETPFGDVTQAYDWAKNTAIPTVVGGVKAAGRGLARMAQDPHTTLPAVGAVAGGLGAGVPSAGLEAVPGAAGGAALGETAADLWDLYKGRRPANVTSGIGEAALGGAMGEVIPAVGKLRPLQSEAGQAVERLYGATAMPHQMTESSLLDFLYNIAGGMTGRSRIEAQHEAQRTLEGAGIRKIAADIHPSLGIPSDVAAQNVRHQAARTFEQAQKPLQKAYGDWLNQYGNTVEVGPLGEEGASVKALHSARGDALQRGRDALADGDAKTAFQANKEADSYLARIQKLVGPDASDHYDALNNAYRQVMDKYDNPLMSKLRRGVHPEQLADMLLNPEAKFPKVVPLGSKVSQTIPDMMSRVKEALPPQSWQELKAATLQKLFENSTKLSSANATVGELAPKAMKDQINRMGQGAFQTLFEDSAQPIMDFAEATAAGRRRPGQTGKFFIDLRQAAAVSLVGSAAAGAVLGGGGDRREAAETGALAAAGTYLVAPWALARMMTNPNLRGLFIRGLEETDPTVKQQIAQGLNRLLVQTGTSATATMAKTPAVQQGPRSGLPKMGDVQIPPAPRPTR